MLVWIFPRGCLMQNSLASPFSTALSVEPETRSSAEVANLQHIRTICSSFGKREEKKKKKKHQNSRVGLWSFTEVRARGRREWHGRDDTVGGAAPQRIKGLMGVFFP